MTTSVKQPNAMRQDEAPRRKVTITLSKLAFEALVGRSSEDAAGEAPAKLEGALRSYLGDRGLERPAWPYPGFLRGSETRNEVPVSLEIEEELWLEFGEEARRQNVSIEQLSEHAAFYLAAEVEAGRATQRILDDVGSTEDDAA